MEILPGVAKGSLIRIIKEADFIDGFAISGSIPGLSGNNGGRINADVFFASYLVLPYGIQFVRTDIEDKFREFSGGIELKVRNTISREMRDILIPTPFADAAIYVFRSEAEKVVWNIPPEMILELIYSE